MPITVGGDDGLRIATVGRCCGGSCNSTDNGVGAAIGKGVGDRLGHVIGGPGDRCASGRVGGRAGLAITEGGDDGLRIATVAGRTCNTSCSSS